MNSEPEWAAAARQFQQTMNTSLTDGWSKSLAQATQAFQSAGTASVAENATLASLPKITFSPDKLKQLQQQYVEESAKLWNVGMDAAVISKDRRFADEAWGTNPFAAFSAAA